MHHLKLSLNQLINKVELPGDFSLLGKNYEEDNLKDECDMCLYLENEMFISVTREDKDDLALKLIDIYIENNIKPKEKIF